MKTVHVQKNSRDLWAIKIVKFVIKIAVNYMHFDIDFSK